MVLNSMTHDDHIGDHIISYESNSPELQGKI